MLLGDDLGVVVAIPLLLLTAEEKLEEDDFTDEQQCDQDNAEP